MGSGAIQGQLWGEQPKNWASIQEQTRKRGYDYLLNYFQPSHHLKLLDVGCGTGLFCSLAALKGAEVTGFDASEPLLEEAKQRTQLVKFVSGEMEELPFADDTFDLVCGFNSFQYAANIQNALTEARRVLKTTGKLAVMIWGNKEDCEAATYLKAIGSLLPPPPPGAPGPFALSENQLLENTLQAVGFTIVHHTDIASVWDYPNVETALKGLTSAGPAARAIANSGVEKVYQAILDSLQPYIQSNGHVVYHNKFRIVIAEKEKL